jgi:hypothetical protein
MNLGMGRELRARLQVGVLGIKEGKARVWDGANAEHMLQSLIVA